MKFIVFDIIQSLANSIIGYAEITRNVCLSLRSDTHNNAIFLKTENEAPEGKFSARITDSKIILNTGEIYGIEKIDMSKHFILFDPDSTFKTLSTGFACERSLTNLKDIASDQVFILMSENEGPKKDWVRATLEDNILDFGEVIKVEKLAE